MSSISKASLLLALLLAQAPCDPAGESAMNNPPVRLNRSLVKFDPVTGRRTLIEDWTGTSGAEETEAEIRELLNRFAPPALRALFRSTPLYMAPLPGASGHTAEEPDNHQQFVIYIDPFRAAGCLHTAATLVHELSHVERYLARGFHVNRAAAILPKADFILLGAADELAAYREETALVRSFLDGSPDSAKPSSKLRWPVALTVLLGLEGPSDAEGRMNEVRRQIMLDLHRQASRYWDIHHDDALDPSLASSIRNWYSGSEEWKRIAVQRAHWLAAGAQVEWAPVPQLER